MGDISRKGKGLLSVSKNILDNLSGARKSISGRMSPGERKARYGRTTGGPTKRMLMTGPIPFSERKPKGGPRKMQNPRTEGTRMDKGPRKMQSPRGEGTRMEKGPKKMTPLRRPLRPLRERSLRQLIARRRGTSKR